MNNIKLKEEKNILFIKKGIIPMRYYIYYFCSYLTFDRQYSFSK